MPQANQTTGSHYCLNFEFIWDKPECARHHSSPTGNSIMVECNFKDTSNLKCLQNCQNGSKTILVYFRTDAAIYS